MPIRTTGGPGKGSNNPHTEATATVPTAGLPNATIPYQVADFVDGIGVYYDYIAPTCFPEHAHPEISVDVCYKNTSCLATWQTATGRQLTRLLREGHVSVIAGGQPHASEWRQGAEHLVFYLAPAFVERAARDLLRKEAVEIVENRTAEDPLIRQLAGALRAELRGERPPERLYIESLANVLAVHLLRNYSADKKPLLELTRGLSKRKLGRVTDYIADNLHADLTLAELAGAAGLSPYHFARQFKQAVGLTPHQYVVLQRVERARELLASTNLPIGDIAATVGFAHQSHLARHIRHHFGVSPSALRR